MRITQYMPVLIAYQGEPQSYSHQAIEAFGKFHGVEFSSIPARDFPALFEHIMGETGLGIVPIENSAGGIVASMDILLSQDVRIIGEIYIPIRHYALGFNDPTGASLEGKIVHSHPQALTQCQRFIRRKGLLAKVEDDTAGSARLVSELSGEERYRHIAIASELAAGQYGLDVIEANIQDHRRNTTRFLIVRPRGGKTEFEDNLVVEEKYKATFAYTIDPSELYRVLVIVHQQGLKTYTVHNRAAAEQEGSDRIFNRMFFQDIGVPIGKEANFKAVSALLFGEFGVFCGDRNQIKFLGYYPKAEIDMSQYE